VCTAINALLTKDGAYKDGQQGPGLPCQRLGLWHSIIHDEAQDHTQDGLGDLGALQKGGGVQSRTGRPHTQGFRVYVLLHSPSQDGPGTMYVLHIMSPHLKRRKLHQGITKNTPAEASQIYEAWLHQGLGLGNVLRESTGCNSNQAWQGGACCENWGQKGFG
jgi:hypothetical protein